MHKKSVIFFLVVFLLAFAKADIISLNSGGDNTIVINPDSYVEGFFSGEGVGICVPYTCAGLGYTCGTFSDGCGGTITCGALGGLCASGYTCIGGTCFEEEGGDEGGDAGGDTGGGETEPSVVNISVTPSMINLTLLNGTYKQENIKITNLGTSSQVIHLTKVDPDSIVSFDSDSFTIDGGDSITIHITFLAPIIPGIYTATIRANGEEVVVNLNSKEKLLLFDSNIVVLNRDYLVSQGNQLKTKVELVPMGDKERLDVTLNYVIKDYTGKVYLTQSETVLVEERMDFKRNFGTGRLPLGNFIVGLELVYPGGVAPSSAHFEVVERSIEDTIGYILFFLVIGILLVVILIIFLLIRMRRHKKVIGYLVNK